MSFPVPAALAPLTLHECPTPAQLALAAAPLPTTPIPDYEERLFQLFKLIEDHMQPGMSGRYGALLQDIAEDQVYDGITYLGLMRAPDGTPTYGGEGGLVRSMLRQWELWTRLRDRLPLPESQDILPSFSRNIPEDWLNSPDVTNETVLMAIINDGLSRGWAHFIEFPRFDGGGFGVILGDHESTKLLSAGAKALMLLQQRDIILDGQMIHLLLPNADRHIEHWTPLARLQTELELLALLYVEG